MEMYFRIRATENEHCTHRQDIDEYSQHHQIIVHYYRKIKTGHQPCWREVKVEGERFELLRLKEAFKDIIRDDWRNNNET